MEKKEDPEQRFMNILMFMLSLIILVLSILIVILTYGRL